MIYIVEDEENIRKLISYALSREGFQVQGFSDGGELAAALEEKTPGLILLDIMLPGEDGLSVLKSLRSDSRFEAVPVIMVTAKGSEFDKVTGLDSGADDYITKPFGIAELISRVKAVLRRYEKNSQTEKTYRIGELYVNPEKHIIRVGNEDISLSFKEYTLLMMLLSADGRVVPREELLSRVWGEFYDESRTLDVHIRKLRIKLLTAEKYIKTVKGIGYRIGGEEDE